MTQDLTAWRALVDKELAGAPFAKLVQETTEGLAIEPLYTTRPEGAARPLAGAGWQLCVRAESAAEIAEAIAGGADAIWCPPALATAATVPAIVDGDPRVIDVLGWHEQGADAVEETALVLAGLAAGLRDGRTGLSARVALGRDTFGQVCKLRALRVCWDKIMAASGRRGEPLAMHAVCSRRTLTVRDPWVNMLRVTTQVFAGALGGAQLVTPVAFDAAFAAPGELGRRLARNTALVLREESLLGRVVDAAGGSYYLESRTDALARRVWARFQEIEAAGGLAAIVDSGALAARLAAAWRARAAGLAKRKQAILGVSEFANLTEQLPGAPAASAGGHRDSEAFEALRARVESAGRSVALVPLGPPAEHRARLGFAEGFFAVAGLAPSAAPTDIACLCGSDERYAAEAAAAAAELKAKGVRRVVLAGRPNQTPGVDAYIYLGCDVLATCEEILQ